MNHIKNARIIDMLSTAFGKEIQHYLADDGVVEIMLNPNGQLWIDQLNKGRSYTGHNISSNNAQIIIRVISSLSNKICNRDNPTVSAELPESGARFQGVLPPVTNKPSFNIRKKAISVFTLDNYIKKKIMTEKEAQIIKDKVQNKCNILISGGAGTGKTTLANAILDEVSKTYDRLVIIEDTLEMQCTAKDFITLKTTDSHDINDLLKVSLRLKPERIVVGEIRSGEALSLLKAWNTGHPGGLCTIHANSAHEALTRIEQLIQEVVASIPYNLIASTINTIISISKVNNNILLNDILTVDKYDPIKNEYITTKIN